MRNWKTVAVGVLIAGAIGVGAFGWASAQGPGNQPATPPSGQQQANPPQYSGPHCGNAGQQTMQQMMDAALGAGSFDAMSKWMDQQFGPDWYQKMHGNATTDGTQAVPPQTPSDGQSGFRGGMMGSGTGGMMGGRGGMMGNWQ